MQRCACAVVQRVHSASESVRVLELKVTEPHFRFLPGQWVDFFMPGVDKVGGFSICSSPRQLQQSGFVQLAVKRSSDAASSWVHSSSCCTGVQVRIKAGGDFVYDNREQLPAVFVAGGIGINPLISMLRHIHEAPHPVPCTLLYSAQRKEDLVFGAELEDLARRHAHSFEYIPILTRTRPGAEGGTNRMSKALIARHLPRLDRFECFVCGPPGMIDNVASWFLEIGVAAQRIHYEKWW